MYLLQTFSSYSLYLIVFIFFYLVIEKFFLWDYVIKLKKFRIIENFIFGFSIGVITLIMQLINGIIYKKFKIPLFISTAILIAIFKDYKKSLFSLFPGFIFYLFNNYEYNSIYVTIFFSFFSLIVIFYLKMFLPKKLLSISYFFFLLTCFLLTILLGTYHTYFYNFKTTFIDISTIYYLTILGYYFMNYIIKFIISSKLLYESSRYSFLKFFRPSIATNSINEFLIKNKIKYGFLVMFHLNYDKDYAKFIEENTNINIENYFYELLQKIIFKNGILFSYEGDENGFFIPVKRKKGQKMISKKLNNVVEILNKKYFWKEKEIPLKVATSFGVSKYGIDSQNINKLIIYSSFALNNQPNNNQIIYFDWKIYHSFLKDNEDINELDATFQLDNLTSLFIPLYDLNNNCHFATYANVYDVSEFQNYETVREIAYIKNFQNTLDRYFASSALLDAKSNKVIINYSPTIFENNFFESRFLDFFKRNNINYNSVYMIFDQIGIDKVVDFILTKKRVQKICDLGIKIIVPNNCSLKKIKQITDSIEYTYINANEIKNFKNNYKKIQTICYNIKSSSQVLLAYKKNIKILGGPIFDQELNFIKFTKQSKIYLENIIKGVNHE